MEKRYKVKIEAVWDGFGEAGDEEEAWEMAYERFHSKYEITGNSTIEEIQDNDYKRLRKIPRIIICAISRESLDGWRSYTCASQN